MYDIFSVIGTALESVYYQLFTPLDMRFDILQTVLVFFIAFSVHRFLLRPIFGGSVGSSDKARKVSKEEKSESTEVSIIG